jgi:hypothetical protein
MKQISSCTRSVGNQRLDRRDDGGSRGYVEHWASGRSAVRASPPRSVRDLPVRAPLLVSVRDLPMPLSVCGPLQLPLGATLRYASPTITHVRVRTLLALIMTMRPQGTDTERMCS